MTIRDSSEITTARLYRVQDGDDLCSIALHLFGSADLWIFVYAANQREVSGIHGIRPGQILCIPELGELVSAKDAGKSTPRHPSP
jgi:hypothetical protein